MRYLRNENDAVEVLNIGFLKILNKLDQRKAHVPFEAWIRRVMINTVIDEYRKRRKYEETEQQVDFSEYGAHEAVHVDYNAAERKFDAAAIEALIRQLPAVSQQVFNLHAIDGYSHKEIAEMLGISDGTSKWHVSFARKKLKEWLAQAMKVMHTMILI
jgi:RNA polymerase sigma-70 factor (ECF subfamily)